MKFLDTAPTTHLYTPRPLTAKKSADTPPTMISFTIKQPQNQHKLHVALKTSPLPGISESSMHHYTHHRHSHETADMAPNAPRLTFSEPLGLLVSQQKKKLLRTLTEKVARLSLWISNLS